MSNSVMRVPVPQNEPVFDYREGSAEKQALKAEIAALKQQQFDIPLIIGGKEIRTGRTADIRSPYDHSQKLGQYHIAGPEEFRQAVAASQDAWKTWSEMPWTDRAAIFLRVAELLSTKYRARINAATMLSIGKTAHQAEIDSACELIDFLRFNVAYMQQIYGEQPLRNAQGVWNASEYRALEGFILAITPFNFTAIAGNLPTSPAMMGNVVLWKPSPDAIYAPYFLMQIMREAGLPDGVINLVPCDPEVISDEGTCHPDFAGVHFTGSTGVFKTIWETIGSNIKNYKYYPRIVGETGGKDFIVVHKSADVRGAAVATVRGAFEFMGQKCSAASRVFVPAGMRDQFLAEVDEQMKLLGVGSPEDFRNFMGAVVSEKAFRKIAGYLDYARECPDISVHAGGGYDDSTGWFIEPSVLISSDPHNKLLREEIFGPVVTLYFYEDDQWAETLELVDKGAEYGLTGAVFSNDRQATLEAQRALRHAAGNFYINDKPTGAVVGQQPFGGGRASGTNDKAGSYLNLLRWVNSRTIKETFVPPQDIRYPYMEAQ